MVPAAAGARLLRADPCRCGAVDEHRWAMAINRHASAIVAALPLLPTYQLPTTLCLHPPLVAEGGNTQHQQHSQLFASVFGCYGIL